MSLQNKLAVCALAISAMLPAAAVASTVSYMFTQDGFSDNAGATGILSGAFSGTPEANGAINLVDLTSFNAQFVETVGGMPNTFIFNVPATFTYDQNGISPLEFSAGSAAIGIQVCGGSFSTNAICFNLPPGGPVAVNASGSFMDLPMFGQITTRAGLSVTQVPAAAVPEPSTPVMISIGAAMLGLGAALRKHRSSPMPQPVS